MNLYEQMLIGAVIAWIHAHKSMQERIGKVRPHLVQLRDALNEVLSDTEPATEPQPPTA